MSDGLDALLSGLPRQAPLSAEEERALIVRAHAGDSAAGKELATRNIRLVVKWVRPFCRHGYDDLVQEGMLGLMRAIEKFDTGRGVRFSSYAEWWVKAYARRFANNESESADELAVPSDGELVEQSAGPEDALAAVEEHRLARRAVNDAAFSQIERSVLLERVFGGKSLRATGDAVGRSRHRVSQIEASIRKKVVAAATKARRAAGAA